MANWQVMVQREQAARDREGKKLGQLLSRHAEYTELQLKTRSILMQYANKRQLYRQSIHRQYKDKRRNSEEKEQRYGFS